LDGASFAPARQSRIEVIQLDEIAIGRFILKPGWRWSPDIAPTVRYRFMTEPFLYILGATGRLPRPRDDDASDGDHRVSRERRHPRGSRGRCSRVPSG
jgi:hypothetical protein